MRHIIKDKKALPIIAKQKFIDQAQPVAENIIDKINVTIDIEPQLKIPILFSFMFVL